MAQFNDIPGYALLRTEELRDVKGTGFLFRHERSGARVVVIKNDDENKVFCIGFKTPPGNSTGVQHITEHSVLCGSKKFPVKDPFMELEKGSLNTFLNAMTYPDKTLYPVASCNDTDFKNLTDVYMDAVLNPNIHTCPEIFRQEGWHYEMDDPDDDLRVNGIVYSEMKGVYSSPDEICGRKITDNLFPDTCYGYDSGGDPDEITNLSYDEFCRFHKTYYHPSNSYIWIYGDVDVAERLEWMDKEYLVHYEKKDIDSGIELQKPFGGMRDIYDHYPADEPDPSGKGVYYSYSVLAGKNDDLITGIGMELLGYCLFEAPGAPVRQALLDAGICDDVADFYDGENLQSSFSIIAKNSKPGLHDLFVSVLKDSLEKVVKNGIREDSLNAALNSAEFKYREADFGRFPKGLVYGTTAFSTWLYDDDKPFTTLHMNEAYARVREKIGTDWFVNMISDYLLHPQHGVILTLEPEPGAAAKKEADLQKKIAALKASFTKDEIEKIVEDTHKLRMFHDTPDSAEDLLSIPLLDISEIKPEPRTYNYERIMPEVGELVRSDYETNEIVYFTACFPADPVSAEELGYLGLLSDMLGYVDTAKHSYGELNDEINMYTGGMGSDLNADPIVHTDMSFKYLWVGTKFLFRNADKALDLVTEMIGSSVFSDVKRNREILFEARSNLESHLAAGGTEAMKTRAGAYFQEGSLFVDETSGIGYYDFLRKLTDNYDSMQYDIARKLKEISKRIFRKAGLKTNIICNAAGEEKCRNGIVKLYDSLPDGESEKLLKLKPVIKNEGFKTPGQVQFICRAGNFISAGIEPNGVYSVLASIISDGYLWNEIRGKGGAYGTGLSINLKSGYIAATSYRDPNLRSTNEIFESLFDYVERFDVDEREMRKAIIGTFGGIDAPLTPRLLGRRAFSAYLSGTTYEDALRNRREALYCTAADIRKCAAVVRAMLDAHVFCASGAARTIEENSDLFKNIRNLIN